MKKVCRNCSSDDVNYIRKDMLYPTPVIFLALGGVLFSMVYGLSRPGIHKCNNCKETFKRHSIDSILMQPFLWVYLLFYICIVITIVFEVGLLIWQAI